MTVPESAAGKSGACGHCNRTVQVPAIQFEIQEPQTSTAPPNQFPVMIDRDEGVSGRSKYLMGFVILTGLALLTSQTFPRPTAWLGRILLIACLTAFIPVVKQYSRRLLRIEVEGKDWRTRFKLGLFTLTGIVLISVSQISSSRIAEATRLADEKAAAQAKRNVELQRLTKKANERVVSAVKTAEIYWQYKNLAKVEETLKSASNIPHATNFKPVQELRTRIADSQVKSLVSEATDLIKAGDLDKGREIVLMALKIPHASNVSFVEKLDSHILNAIDPKHNRASLMQLSDTEFQGLQTSGTMPEQFISGYRELDTRIAVLTKAHVADVVAERKKREQERVERERLLAIAAQKAMEERKALEAAEELVKRKNERTEKIKKCFSSWDGSHRGLTSYIKETMNDPSSYEHAKTVYWDRTDHLVVQTTFRGKNGFGALILSRIKAKVDLNGNVIEVLELEP